MGQAIPIPDGSPAGGLEADVNAMRGQVRLTPSVANDWLAGGNQGGAPRTDWRSLRVGAQPPEVLARLRGDTGRDILAACGVPGGLVGQTDGTTLREQLRQFLHVGINPVAGQLADTIRQAFDLEDFEFDFLTAHGQRFGREERGPLVRWSRAAWTLKRRPG